MTATQGLWPSVVLALVLFLIGLVLLALALVVPLALAVAKAALVGWAARTILRRFPAERPEPPPDPPTKHTEAFQPREHERRPRGSPPASPQRKAPKLQRPPDDHTLDKITQRRRR